MPSKFDNVIKPIIDYTLMAVCFVMIIVTGIMEKSHPICVLPLINSLIIMILSMRAYRITHLLGSINCLIYTVGYLIIGVYGALISTLFVSFPVQLATFFMWGKNKYKKSTMFKKLPLKWEILLGLGIVVACVVGSVILVLTNHSLEKSIVDVLGSVNDAQKFVINVIIVIDSIGMVLGIIIPFMSMFALIEAMVFNIVNTSLALLMWILMVILNPMQTPYLVSAVFNLYCIIWAAVKWVRLYKEQQKEKKQASQGEILQTGEAV